ncbi:hypothetical protein HanRHA438_Chr09g0379711 [Helianthus annuus]|nr:hypothetical protein HanRHA438_Chr09g0379711 [Helianthus annuus]
MGCTFVVDPCESETQICLRASKRQVWGCDTWLKTGLLEFKELFGSFTGHRSENGTTGKRHGSTGSKECKKTERSTSKHRRRRPFGPSPTVFRYIRRLKMSVDRKLGRRPKVNN